MEQYRTRAALYMAAVVPTQYNPDIRRLYQRLIARGKTKMSALRPRMGRKPKTWSPIDEHYEAIRQDMFTLMDDLQIGAYPQHFVDVSFVSA